MSDFEQTEAPRVLEEIDANEVSLVDQPAIQRTFLVVKRHSEKDMPREEINLEAEKDEEQTAEAADSDSGTEKDEEGAVAQDASENSGSEEDTDEAEKADPTKVMEAAAELLPWLRSQLADAEGDLKGQISAFLDALGADSEESDAAKAEDTTEEGSEADEEADEAEKAESGWQSQLAAVNEALTANVSKAEDAEEEEDEEMAKSDESGFVTTEQFETFATGVTNALTNIATSMAKVSKSVQDIESFTPVSKAADDQAPVMEQVSKGNTDDALFGNLFGKR